MSKVSDLLMAIFMVAVPTCAIVALIWMLVIWTQCLVSIAQSLSKISGMNL